MASRLSTRLAPLGLLALLACEGPMGPMGPTGPKGEPGEATEVLSQQGVIPEIGALSVRFWRVDIEKALVNGWIADPSLDLLQWVESSTVDGATCTATQDDTDLWVGMAGPPGWRYLITIIRPAESG